MASSSTSAYSDDHQDASEPSDSDRQGPSNTSPPKGRQSHQAQPRPRQDEPALEGPLSQPRQLLDQPDSMVQPGQGQSSERKSGQRKSRPEQPRQPKGVKSGSAQKEVKGNYRDLLNSVITEAAARRFDDDGALFTSQIGGSLWTSREKDSLFRRMCLTGRDDLPSLCRAVPTKSESEIRVYLRLLEQEHKTLLSRSDFDIADIPAVFEVSEDCENALDESADTLAMLVNEHDTSLQQTEFGENWLVDEESAYYIDLVYDQAPNDDHEAENEDAEPVSNEGLSLAESDASITLLRPSSFLQLSRSLFMNSGEGPEYNWQLADLLAESVESPAIFRGAFEDFHYLTVSLTRRLVQVSLFQAMTRLRAGDSSRPDWTPLAAVREADVRSALDVLGTKSNAKEYWATAARRCKVDVFTESKKYMDGRKGTKAGVKLTYDEVEKELGLEKGVEVVDEVTEEDVDDVMADSDIFTESETEEEEDSKRPRKRKRDMSPSTLLRAETNYLDAVDHNASVEEESRLWKMLRLDPPEHVNLQEAKLPEHPGRGDGMARDWRVEYEAEWERGVGCVEVEEFVEMERVGAQGRRRREALYREARGRMDGVDEEDGEEKMLVDEETGDDSDEEEQMDDESDQEMADDSVGEEGDLDDGDGASQSSQS